MSLGKNLQYFRKQQNITQENLAERMGISRQTVSKWESDEVCPEVSKLIGLADLFGCKVDTLLREDISARNNIYSVVTIKKISAFRMARYVMITPNPEDDVNKYMDIWAEQSGLLKIGGNTVKKIGWDFPYVSLEQRSRFNLRGYVAAYILPNDFETTYPGAEICEQPEAEYAVITIQDPFAAAFERIPEGYKLVLEYLNANGFKENVKSDGITCFEYIYEKDQRTYMDVFIRVDGVGKANLYTFV